jgi:Tfp pilus assembly protein PilW
VRRHARHISASPHTRRQRGAILLETMVAGAMLLIVATGLMNTFLVAVANNQAQGNIATRTTDYAQEKMEALLALDFSDPALGGAMASDSTVGSLPPQAAAGGYADYWDWNGQPATASTAAYARQWAVSTDSTGTLKTITVVVTGKVPKGSFGLAPTTKLVCLKWSGQ